MGARHLAATAALAFGLGCAPRAPALPLSVALSVGAGESEPRVIWVAPGPDAWDGPVIGQAIDGFEDAFRSRLRRVVGAGRLVRWVQIGALTASGVRGPTLSDDAPWVLELQVEGWGVRTGDAQVESFLELGVALMDEAGATVWSDDLTCVETLLPAPVPGAAEVARALVGLDNEDLRARYSSLASTCGERAWALAAHGPGRGRPGKRGTPGR